MSTATMPGTAGRRASVSAWVPLTILPIAAVIVCSAWPRWLCMWSLAVTIYAGLKWLSFAHNPHDCEMLSSRAMGYLLLWPGMDAAAFFGRKQVVPAPRTAEWVAALAKFVVGISLLVLALPMTASRPLVAAWTGMAAIVFLLHFGLFHLLSLCWRRAGVDARPIMNAPILSTALAEFWGRRWNLAFRDLAHVYIFRPLVGRCGVAWATMATFIVSGLIHDFVISLPAGADFGRPTAYFAVQGLGLLIERSRLGRRIGLGRGLIGWLFCMLVATAPLGLLFHHPFIERVVIPMLAAWRAL
jgi:Membrane bound O-acyl transferase family